MANLVPRDFWGIPTLTDINDDFLSNLQIPTTNVSISEDDSHVHVEAALPGLNPQDIDVTYDRGVLWIRGEHKEEENNKKKKYYQKATQSFSYKIAVPGDISQNAQPNAIYDNGIVKITFEKNASTAPKKIPITSGQGKGEKNEAKKTAAR